ncbi:MAG: hypothetical protein ACYS0K_13410 [Planctomycetota bacterium]|jgi:hypothetical protein
MSEEDAAKASLHEKPMMVLVYDANDEEARYAIEQDRNFTNEKVAIGARFFDRMAIDSENAAKDHLFGGKLGRLPSLYFLRPNYEIVTVMRGKFSAGKVFRAMCATMQKDYENCVNTVLKKQREIMKDRVALDKDLTKIERLTEQIADEKSARKRKAMLAERDALEKTVNDSQAKLTAREDALYALKLKKPKA